MVWSAIFVGVKFSNFTSDEKHRLRDIIIGTLSFQDLIPWKSHGDNCGNFRGCRSRARKREGTNVTKGSDRRSYACGCKAKFTYDMKAHSHTYLRLISPTVSNFFNHIILKTSIK
jgi:hypothetical protein